MDNLAQSFCRWTPGHAKLLLFDCWNHANQMGLEPRAGTGTWPKPRLGLEGAVFLFVVVKIFCLPVLFICLHQVLFWHRGSSLHHAGSFIVGLGLSSCYPSLPRPGIKPMAPVVEAQSSNHWTTNAFPKLRFLTSVAERTQWETKW